MKELITMSAWAKKASLLVLASGLVLSSCSEKNDAPAPVDPVVVAQDKVLATLTTPANGWEAAIYPSNNQRFGGYTVFVSFAKDGSVAATSELQAEDAVTSSKFELKSVAGATAPTTTLSLPLNAAIRLASEDATVAALSAHTDESFDVVAASDSEVKLVGKTNGTVVVLRPATTEAWKEQLAKVKASRTGNLITRFNVLVGDQTVATGAIREGRQIVIAEQQGQSLGYPFRYTVDGIEFFQPVAVAGKTMQRLVSNASLTEPELKAKESELTLKAQANDLTELLSKGHYKLVENNILATADMTGRALRSVNRVIKRVTPLGIDLKSVSFGTKDKVFGLHVVGEHKIGIDPNRPTRVEPVEFTIPFTYEVTALNEMKFTFNAQAIEGGADATQNSQLYNYTIGQQYRMDILAACFANIGVVTIGTTKVYNESYEGRVFTLTADNQFNPTKLILTDVKTLTPKSDGKVDASVITFDLTK